MKTDKYGKLFNGEKAPKDFQHGAEGSSRGNYIASPCKDHSEEKVKEGSCCREKGNGK